MTEQEKIAGRIGAVLPGSYWATQSEVQLTVVRAWLALNSGEQAKAVALMRAAAELEATTDKEAVTPGEILPAGELLGEMLVEVGRYADAVEAYAAQLASSPNRFNGLYGAAHAAELAGNREVALQYYRQLMATAAAADPGNERLEHARVYVSDKPLAAR